MTGPPGEKSLLHSCAKVELRSGRKWELQLPSARARPLSCALRSLVPIQVVDDKVCESAEVPPSFTSEVWKHFGFPTEEATKTLHPPCQTVTNTVKFNRLFNKCHFSKSIAMSVALCAIWTIYRGVTCC